MKPGQSRAALLQKILAKNRRRRKLLQNILMIAFARRRMILRAAHTYACFMLESKQEKNTSSILPSICSKQWLAGTCVERLQ